jgi:hypothetical protein
VTLVAIGGCAGGSHGKQVDGNGGDGAVLPDAQPGDGLSTCTDQTAPRALLAAITANDVVDLYTLAAGHLTPVGVHLTGITKPGPIVMRDDGAEALVVFGGFGRPFGFAAITVAPDGSSASVAQVVQIGTDSTPISVAYSDHDHAVIALEAANAETVGLTRGTSGFVAGTRVPAPALYPLAVRSRPGTLDVLLSRSQVGVDDAMDIYRLQQGTNGTWTSSGSHGSVADQPIAMVVHPSGAALYSPTGDPASPVSSSNLDAPGLLHAVTISNTSFTDAGTVALPRSATVLAMDPLGRFVVTDGGVYVLDNNNNPNEVAYTWQTVKVGLDGTLGQVYALTPQADGLLFDDLVVARSGHLVAARELYPGSVPDSQEYPLELWAQPQWGSWQKCDTALLSGGAHVAISP